ncbi:BTAD domain-containing putative transcriptional regulator [Nonomuraea jiangxiensis]|uniref:Predicted ATPase n=1 Tax=Nonomuraea jiangxiensis TaxID=633440 RepID=A0A1G8QRC2_9ACTN|nr:BTAD domain-containing putative transcriptional regulator [Nonomuraea jiangxiensis]SDJ07264.1 Predicted ATPase [Nonomuraea jiangxiensis]
MNSAGFEFGILGPLDVLHGPDRVAVKAAKLRILLAVLLLNANRVVSVETLTDHLWDQDPPAGARNTLQNYVLRLRRLLAGTGAGVPLLTRPHGYQLEVTAGALDLDRFDVLLRRARTAATAEEMEQASALLREALRLWRGDPLLDVPSEALRRDVVPALRERRLDALQLRIEADLALGRHERVLVELRELTAAHPLRERFWAQRMLALYRSERRGEALGCFHEARRALAAELGIDPGTELRELHQRLLSADAALISHHVVKVRGNLPAPVTTFIGRRQERTELARLLATGRLVTLTGVGGVGKTRLARQAAEELGSGFPDGVWLVDLAALAEPRLLIRTVNHALGARDQSARPEADILRDHLRDKRLLLVLDNCEHMVPAVAGLAGTLLLACPGLQVLATSRQRLGLQGEHVLPVPPLPLPPPHANGRDAGTGPPLTGYDAVALLVDRAAAAGAAFRIDRHNQALVAQLCRRLDGIPLAIELAAVRLSTLSVGEILERLDGRFRLLADGNATPTPRYHQALYDVIEWSHDLCTESERLLWAQLSVFSGGFDLEAAEAVCSGPDVPRHEVLDILTGLAHKSIIEVRVQAARTRYRLLETIRQYGRQRLDDLGLRTAVRRRHHDHYRRLAAESAAGWCGAREVEWLCRLRQELPNLRSALDFCVTEPGRAHAGLEIAANLTRNRFWFFSSTIAEGRQWLERMYGLCTPPAGAAGTGAVGAGAAATLSWLSLIQGDRQGAEAFLAECRVPAAQAVPAVAYVEGVQALLVRGSAEAIPMLARARQLFRQAGEHGDAHMATMFWAMACAFLGERDAAVAAAGAYLAEAEASGAAWAYSWALWTLGLVEQRHGSAGESVGLIRESLRRQQDIDDRWGPAWGSEVLAWAVARTGDHILAAELLGAAGHLRQVTGVRLVGLRPFHDAHAQAVAAVRRELGAEAYEAARERGSRIEDVIPFACASDRSASGPARSGDPK